MINLDWILPFRFAYNWGTAAGAAVSLIGSSMQSDSAGDAASQQQQATDSATAEQRRQFDLNRSDLAPYRNAGTSAVNRIRDLLGLGGGAAPDTYQAGQSGDPIWERLLGDFNARHTSAYGAPINRPWSSDAGAQTEKANLDSLWRTAGGVSGGPDNGSLNKKFTLADFWDDPVTQASYQFGLDAGTKALTNMAGARGNRNSGAQLKALTKFGTDYTGGQAAGSSGRFYGDQDRTFNRLSGLAGTGQTAATNTAQLGQNNANTISGLMTSQGNARGAAAIAQGNAWGGAASNIGNWWNQQQMLDKILNRGGSSNAGWNVPGSGYGTGVWDV